MIVAEHISHVLPIDTQASRASCITTMLDNVCFELPVLRDGKLYGMVELGECIHSEEDTIESLVEPGYASVHSSSNLFDVLRIFNDTKANVCCVLGENLEWIGIITKTNVLEALAQSLTVGQIGAVIVLEMAAHQYSSSEISRIIESEGSQILGMWLTNTEGSGRIQVTIKLNTQNAERIINSLQRFSYEVIAIFGDEDYKDNVERRFESLMKYIDL